MVTVLLIQNTQSMPFSSQALLKPSVLTKRMITTNMTQSHNGVETVGSAQEFGTPFSDYPSSLNWKGFQVQRANAPLLDTKSMRTGYSAANYPDSSCGKPTISLGTPTVNGLTVTVNGVTLPGGSGCSISSILWNWGDNSSSTSWFPASHTYCSPGTYTITATTYQSDDQIASASTTASPQGQATECPSIYPESLQYQPYTSVGSSRIFTINITSGRMAISLGVLNGSATVQVTEGSQLLLSRTVAGKPFNEIAVSGAASYCYVNFDYNNQLLSVSVSTVSGEPVLAYNIYDNYISNYTASLITRPPQFAANMNAPSTPINTGLSFLLIAPKYPQPTPLAIWVGEGFTDPSTGNEWWAQVGFNNWGARNMNVSYAGWGIFSNIPAVGNPGGTSNYALTPGDTYNFTMAVVSGTTWEFSVNGTAIQESTLTGFYDTTTSSANEGASLGLETLTSWGANVNITSLITVPVVGSFLVNGKWSEPNAFAFGNIGENWGNAVPGLPISAPGMSLWGIAGHLQYSSVPPGVLLFNDSLPMILDVPGSNYEPLYGDYSYPQQSSGEGVVEVTKTSATSLVVSPVSGLTYVSILSYNASGSSYPFSISDAMITAPQQFHLPDGSIVAVVEAANAQFSEFSSTVVGLVIQTLTTSVGGGSGSVAPSCPGPGGCSETVGSSISLIAMPSANWQFSSWSVAGASCSGGGSSNPCAFSMPNNPVTVSATFAQGCPGCALVTFITNPASDGAISWDSCSNTGYTNGQTLLSSNFGAHAICYVPSGYTFSNWTCTGGLACSGSNDPTTVSFTGPGTITLNLKTGSLSSPVSTSLTASATVNGASFTVSGSLTANGVGLSNEKIVLVFGWSTNIVTLKTASGSYTYTAAAPISAGTYNVDVLFLGDYGASTQYLPSKATAKITVT